jgi:hypothetical protein
VHSIPLGEPRDHSHCRSALDRYGVGAVRAGGGLLDVGVRDLRGIAEELVRDLGVEQTIESRLLVVAREVEAVVADDDRGGALPRRHGHRTLYRDNWSIDERDEIVVAHFYLDANAPHPREERGVLV